jgi:hypothetical protein
MLNGGNAGGDMTRFTVDQIEFHKPDAADAKVLEIFAKDEPNYAVYRTADRVKVQYADDPVASQAQRTSLARLNPIRGEINSLIDGWREKTSEHAVGRVKRFDRSVADSLIVAFEGDVDGAAQVLLELKQDLIDQRTAWARVLYLGVALATVLVLVLVLRIFGAGWFTDHVYGFPDDNIWAAAAAGAIGAFFSVAIFMKKRTILMDLEWVDNAADAVLRIVIGVISAGFLIFLLRSKFVTLEFGATSITDLGFQHWVGAVTVGFLAGFSENLVPDLLAKTPLAVAAPPPPPAGGAAGALAAGGAKPPTPPPSPTGGDGDDSCLCGAGFDPADATADSQLPPTAGGVAAPETPAAPTSDPADQGTTQ